MKFFGFLLAGILLAGSSAQAQTTPSSSLFSPSKETTLTLNNSPTVAYEPASLSLAVRPAARPQARIPIGVYENFDFQAYIGYTFLRFYEAPHMIQSRNGFDSSLVYYYKTGWIGADGELLGAFGSQSGTSSTLAFAGGGVRTRWAAPLGLEVWAHGLVGRAHYTPQTAFGPQGAFAYEVGLGVDAKGHRQRLAYRLELDMIGSKFFSTYQLSPKASIGVVWKF